MNKKSAFDLDFLFAPVARQVRNEVAKFAIQVWEETGQVGKDIVFRGSLLFVAAGQRIINREPPIIVPTNLEPIADMFHKKRMRMLEDETSLNQFLVSRHTFNQLREIRSVFPDMVVDVCGEDNKALRQIANSMPYERLDSTTRFLDIVLYYYMLSISN